MAFKNFKGEIERNLQEQVRANKDNDIALAKEIQSLKTLVGFDIKVIARYDTWEEPTGSFAFGDAIAVGPEGGPFNFYIYTRYSADAENGYWLNYGPISIVGPQGPQGEPGPQGETGKSSRWYVGPNIPTGDIHENDMWLKVNSDGSTNGFIYQYGANGWALFTSILGPQGIQGPEGKQGKQGPIGPTGPQGPAGNPSPVINIIGELPEGSVISDTYDPSTVESNSGILMPVGGVNHLWIIINGRWTDSGSWGQGGTRVYVDGEEVVEFDADTKVDKVDTLTGTKVLIYTTDYDGSTPSASTTNVHYLGNTENNFRPYAIAMVYGTTAGRTAPSGNLITGTPVNSYHCANKAYVDSKIATAHIGEAIEHGTLAWNSLGEEITFRINVGVFGRQILDAGDFTAWGGDLVFYGIGGLVNPGGGNYSDNDAIIHRLVCRADTGTAELQCLYSTGQSWANATSLTTFEIGYFALDDTATDSATANAEFGMIATAGLPGGVFTFNKIPA